MTNRVAQYVKIQFSASLLMFVAYFREGCHGMNSMADKNSLITVSLLSACLSLLGCSSAPKQSQTTENVHKPSSITRPVSERPKHNADQARPASTGSPKSDNRTVPSQELPKVQPHQVARDYRVSGPSAGSGSSTAEEDAKGSAAAGKSTLTEQERVTVMENELDASLTDFDGKLLKEKELLDKRRRSARSQASAGEARTTSGSHADDPRSVESSGNLTGAGMSAQDTPAEHDESPSRVPRRSGAVSGMPDGKDDDIVARQLREAAEQETDPELKKKLWEEYRNYKLGSL